ncbi:nitroreductase [Pseudobacteroides cellulosolvens ATCC 35603 = DSM 2933]|uniref:Nitroreductase n=2 Tax=Pseudobacteroides cellulosolvens TaxID=35825 RepID=A0A0L6JKH5_9FIRM|nr:nitroreductase [Pseudobacteroides cellulosolvens ATCC 35603 = DSM 2933]
MDFYKAVENRRTYYGIGKEKVVPEDRIVEIVENSVKFAPTAFNSQSGRAIVLLNQHHDKLWDMTKEALRKIVPKENFPQTEDRINGFKSGYGTVLFFEDQNVVKYLQEQFALYKDNFPVWSQQASGMLQFIVWTSLEVEGLGVSLQHYNPLIDEDIRKEWNVPENWKLIAQMPFGNVVAKPDEKSFQPIFERVMVKK